MIKVMTETWLDTRTGDLLVGSAAYAEAVEQSLPGDVRLLTDVVRNENFSFTTQDFEKAKVDDWTREDYINFGKWAMKALNPHTEEPKLIEEDIRRLYLLGLGPERRRIRRSEDFKKFSIFQELIGLPPKQVRYPGRYDGWSEQNFVRYAKDLEAKLGHKPLATDYDDMAAEGKGPSHVVIKRRVAGGVGFLDESLGYPNVKSWLEDDFVLWGVKVMEANPNTGLTWLMPDILGAKRRGPTMRAIFDHFPSWKKYKARVEEEYALYQEQTQRAKKAKLEKYRTMISEERLPKHYARLKEDSLLTAAARYIITDTCLPSVSRAEKVDIAKLSAPADQLIPNIRKHDRTLVADDIERLAMELDVFDDIWKMDDYKKFLRLPARQLEAARRHKNRSRNHLRRSRRQESRAAA
jgi:hypothetical protein